MVAVALPNAAWAVFAYDPDDPTHHSLLVGWSTVVTNGQLGVQDADPFGGACVVFACI
jgi:hypothetical protein